jgi:carbonic anhydrase
MLIDDILERNRGWVRGRQPKPLPPVASMRLAVVACYDPRLDPLLLPALGLEPGQAFLLRSAGALLQPGSNTMRSLGLAMFMFGVTEVLVVGHVACRMAAFDTAAFIEEFRRRGVPRDAFGDESLRAWAGAIPSPRQGVLMSVATVREARFVPPDVKVAGVVLDETTGALELVVRPDEAVSGAAVAKVGAGAATVTSAATPSASPIDGHSSSAESSLESALRREQAADDAAAERAASRHGSHGASSSAGGASDRARAGAQRAAGRGSDSRSTAPRSSTPPPPPPGASANPGAGKNPRFAKTRALLEAADGFLATIESKEHWRRDVENLRDELARRSDPRQRLELLDAFARRLGSESREVADAFARLRKEIDAAGTDPAAELLSVFHHLGRRR